MAAHATMAEAIDSHEMVRNGKPPHPFPMELSSYRIGAKLG